MHFVITYKTPGHILPDGVQAAVALSIVNSLNFYF